jgi:hypothetical protein
MEVGVVGMGYIKKVELCKQTLINKKCTLGNTSKRT